MCGSIIRGIEKSKQHNLEKFLHDSVVRIYYALPEVLKDKRCVRGAYCTAYYTFLDINIMYVNNFVFKKCLTTIRI